MCEYVCDLAMYLVRWRGGEGEREKKRESE